MTLSFAEPYDCDEILLKGRSMPTIKISRGEDIDIDSLPENRDDLMGVIVNLSPVLDEPGATDAMISQENLSRQLRLGLKNDFRLAKEPNLEFLTLGGIDDSCYWIYSCDLQSEGAIFVYMVRHGAISEIKYHEPSLAFRDGEGTLHDRLLTPEQLALIDFVMVHRQLGEE